MLARKIELLARTLMQPDTTKCQAESAGQSLLELAKEVGKLQQHIDGRLQEMDAEAGLRDEVTPVPEVKDDTTSWLNSRYTEEELEGVYLEEHDHAHKWLPVRKT